MREPPSPPGATARRGHLGYCRGERTFSNRKGEMKYVCVAGRFLLLFSARWTSVASKFWLRSVAEALVRQHLVHVKTTAVAVAE